MRRLLPITALLTAACVYLPRTTAVYDADCHITARHMELEVAQVQGFWNCRNDGCVALLAAAGAVGAASAVVSGSIVVAGNVVYWFEKRGRCSKDERPLSAPPPAPAP